MVEQQPSHADHIDIQITLLPASLYLDTARFSLFGPNI